MKFKVDENLPRGVSDALRLAGHDSLTVLDQKLGGQPDDLIARVCLSEARVLVTGDADFGNILSYPPIGRPGILLLSARSQSVPAFLNLIQKALRLMDTEPIADRLWVVEDDRIRVRGR